MLSGGELIYRCRKFRGLSQRQLAKKAGISYQMICFYERGRFEPKFEAVQWCLEAMGFELELKEKK